MVSSTKVKTELQSGRNGYSYMQKSYLIKILKAENAQKIWSIWKKKKKANTQTLSKKQIEESITYLSKYASVLQDTFQIARDNWKLKNEDESSNKM